MFSSLKKKLFDEYDGFADKRIKNLDKGQRFIVDDRSPRDFGARGLYSYFCSVFADVLADDRVQVVLSGNVPASQGVDDWAAKYQARKNDGISSSLSFIVERGNESTLNELAECIDGIVAPGKRYDTSNYKYVCPRTAKSLRRLANVLSDYWSTSDCCAMSILFKL